MPVKTLSESLQGKRRGRSPNMFVVPNCNLNRIKGSPPLLCDCDLSQILSDGYLFGLISKAEDLKHIRPDRLRMFLATFLETDLAKWRRERSKVDRNYLGPLQLYNRIFVFTCSSPRFRIASVDNETFL